MSSAQGSTKNYSQTQPRRQATQPLKPILNPIRTHSPVGSTTSTSSCLEERNNLRVLIVDDNFINLRTLSTLLNRRFGHFLAHPPVSVDSGLKAIQQLRSQIFDVVFMDIQMPFLSGVECTKRIRAGEDGVLPFNRDALIVAVTTCTGTEASSLYRQSGFNGLIAKPVKFQEMSDFIIPVSKEALLGREFAEMVSPLRDGQLTYPPLPSNLSSRAFFDTTSTLNSKHKSSKSRNQSPLRSPTLDEELLKVKNGQSDAASISNSENFGLLLEAQTRISLRKDGAISQARTGTISGSTSSFPTTHWKRRSRGSASSSEGPSFGQYDKEVLKAQIAQEYLAASVYDSDGPSRTLSSSPSIHSDFDRVVISQSKNQSNLRRRPPCHHRLSSPAFMVDSPSNDSDLDSDEEKKKPIKRNACKRVDQEQSGLASPTAVRPSISPLIRKSGFNLRSRSTTATTFCSFVGLSHQDGRSFSFDSQNSHTSGSQLSSSVATSPVSSPSPFASLAWPAKVDEKEPARAGVKLGGEDEEGGEEESDHQVFLDGKSIPRHGSTSTIGDDSSCSTPDEEEMELVRSFPLLNFNPYGTLSSKVNGKSKAVCHSSDLSQRLASLQGAFPS